MLSTTSFDGQTTRTELGDHSVTDDQWFTSLDGTFKMVGFRIYEKLGYGTQFAGDWEFASGNSRAEAISNARQRWEVDCQ